MGFNFSGYEPTSGNDVLPEGWYNVTSYSAEHKETKSGGEAISVQFKVLDGPHKDRVVFHNFNIKNASPRAQEIGIGQILTFCQEAGVQLVNKELNDVEDLCGHAVRVKVKIQKSEEYGDQARITSFKAIPKNEVLKEDVPF